MKDFIENVLGPRIQADGGWVEFVSLKDDQLELIFRGECSKCGILNRCCDWIVQEIEKKFGQRVTIVPVRKKPFFWDRH